MFCVSRMTEFGYRYLQRSYIVADISFIYALCFIIRLLDGGSLSRLRPIGLYLPNGLGLNENKLNGLINLANVNCRFYLCCFLFMSKTLVIR